jgi:deoxyribonuclease IV
MPLLGAHMSIAGGYYKAVEAAAALKMDCVQIFTKNNNQWRAKALSDDEAERFRDALVQTGVQKPCAHDSYLINLASPKEDVRQKSIDAFVIELERAEKLGLLGVVMHPGSFLDSSEEEGLDQIVRALDESLERTDGQAVEIWLETTAGQGTNLGHRFEHLAYLIDNVADSSRLGVCVDSCHIFAAGYAISTAAEYRQTMDEFDRLVGIGRVRAFHLNDSKKKFGSRVDRHAHIGQGFLGLEPFRHILNDPRFADLPMYLETPKGKPEDGFDAMNLKTLRGLVKSRRAAKRK